MHGPASELRPSVETPCPVCEGHAFTLVCDAAALSAQADRMRRFHRERLVRAGREELEERADFTQDYATRLVTCGGCGLLLRSPRPSARDVRAAYSEDEYAPERLPEMIASQRALFRRKAPVLARLVGTPNGVLEVGSFVGGFLETCRERGWQALGVDPGRQVVASCRARGLDVFEGTLDQAAEEGVLAPVDCAAVWNTLDQLPHPGPVLARLSGVLRPGGILAVRVPHGACFLRLHARLRASPVRGGLAERMLAWNNLLGFPYLHGYALATLDALIEPLGYQRAWAEGDVLGASSGRATAFWARAEERAMKRLQRAWIARQVRRGDPTLSAAPWLDVYYRRTGAT